MGLFRGMSATLLREPIQFAIYYPSVSSSLIKLTLEGNESRRRYVATCVNSGSLAVAEFRGSGTAIEGIESLAHVCKMAAETNEAAKSTRSQTPDPSLLPGGSRSCS